MKAKQANKVLFIHDGPIRLDKYGNKIITNNILLLQKRYAYLGSEVSFMLRVRKSNIENLHSIETDRNINLIEIPAFNRPKLLLNYFKAKKIIENAILNFDVLVIRLPSTIGSIALKFAKKNNIRYIVEVVACPWDALWNYNLLGKIYAPFAYFKLRNLVKTSPYLIYVSKSFLQNRYPSNGLQTSISNVILENFDNNILAVKKIRYDSLKRDNNIIITTLAAVDVAYKGQKYVLRAIAKLKKKGYNLTYKIAGVGNNAKLKQEVNVLNINENVEFLGFIDRDKIFNLLDETDIYIQPSKTEGLPRAVIEAMSRGCLCLGTNTGGIPELLTKPFLFKKANVKSISEKIVELLNRNDLTIESKLNYEKSKLYAKEVLENRRTMFYDNFLDNI